MNVMLTCAGRRNYLLNFFREVLVNRGQVFAADATPEAPALQEADQSFLLPRVHDIDYIDKLLFICKRYNIRLLIPLNDLELPLLARRRDDFFSIGTVIVVSEPEVIDICFDKLETFKFLESHGIPTAKTYCSLDEVRQALCDREIKYPLVVKPRWGSASIGIEYPEDDEELELAYRHVRKLLGKSILSEISASKPDLNVLIQEHLCGKEYGLDIINNLEKQYITTFVKRKLTMRAGETDRAVTVENQQLQNLGEKIGRSLKHIGNLDCDVIVNANSCSVVEMNPRFGGGYPFSHIAGGNIPAALIAWVSGEQVDPTWLKVRSNTISSKCDRLVCVNGEK